MAVSFVASASSTQNNSTAAFTCAKPTGTLEGHLMVALLSNTELANDLALAGWTMFVDGADASVGGWGSRHIFGFWKAAGPSEPSSYTFEAADSTPHSGAGGIITLAGAHLTEPIKDWVVFPSNVGPSLATIERNTTTTDYTLPSVVAPGAGGMLLAGVGYVAAASFTTGSMTEVWDLKSTGSSATGHVAAYETLAAAGATGTRAFTPNVTTQGAGLIVVIQAGGGKWSFNVRWET